MTQKQKKSAFSLENILVNLAAGGSAGFTEICMMHPLDVVKTRLQLQKAGGSAADPHYYTSVLDCLRKTARSEGATALYKGVLPPICAETPKRALKFLTFNLYKDAIGTETVMAYTVAGLGSGVTEAVLINPFEVVKVAQQSNKSQHAVSPGPYAVLRKIIAEEGVMALNKGVTATIGRNGVFNMVYFGCYNSLNKFVLPKREEYWQATVQKFFVGLGCGTLGSVLNIPFDVAKSRMQGPQPQPGVVKYRGTLRTISIIFREEGFRALYKGLVPKVLRLGPGGGIMMIVYETVSGWLTA